MILILDDHPVARQGLYAIMQMYRPNEEIKQAGGVSQAIDICQKQDASMAFIDVNLGNESGFDFLEWLKKENAATKTFFITSSSRQSDFLLAQKMGVDAYVLKDAFVDEILYGLKVVERGKKFYSSTLMDRMDELSENERLLGELTEREIDVLLLLGQGYGNAKISEMLFITEGTTKKHIGNLLSKLQMASRIELALFANKNPLLVRLSLNRALKEDLRKKGKVLC